ncbi:MAG: protein translocase subunit SecF [Rhodospirillales bacterium]
MLMRYLPDETKIPFLSYRKVAFAFSLLLVLGSIALFSGKGLNYGIDFTGGLLVEVRVTDGRGIADVRRTVETLPLGDVALQEFGQPDDILIRIQRQEGGDEAQQAALDTLQQALGGGVDYRRTEVVGPAVSDELFFDGLLAVGLAILGILVYIWFRFEWQFGLCAVVALVHDVVSTIGLFSLIEHEFNLATVAAVLTIAGYSINDTVVIFDRVRENFRKYKSLSLIDLLDHSINSTLSRTLMTSLTTLIALVALYFLGGAVISDFALAMIWGICVGTYSTIFVAVPLLIYLNPDRGLGDSDAKADDTKPDGAKA